MIEDLDEDKPKYYICVKCGVQTMTENEYKGQYYCSKSYKKSMEYESDTFRKKHDIRYKDPKELTWYQQYQVRQYQERLNDGPQVS